MKEYRYEINGKNYRVRIRETYGDVAVVEVNNQIFQVNIKTATVLQPVSAKPAVISAPGAPAPAQAPARPASSPAGNGAVRAPMPGVILKVLVDEGDMVNAGDPLMIIEAMKMENDIKATISGTVAKIMVDAGDSVNTGDQLVMISSD